LGVVGPAVLHGHILKFLRGVGGTETTSYFLRI